MARLKKFKFNNTDYEFPVEDVKINSTSIVTNGTATIPVDSTVTQWSTNLVTSWAVESAISNATPSKATATNLWLVKLWSNTVQTTAANAVTSEWSRTYAVQLNSSDQAVVNVPWTDTIQAVDDRLDTTSLNPVQNVVITNAINSKQDTLSAGTGISLANNTVTNTGVISVNGSTWAITWIATTSDLSSKQDTLTSSNAWTWISISNGVISNSLPFNSSTIQITLTSAWWSNNEQSVTATGVSASNNVIISPAPSSISDYANGMVYCSAQASNSLTFSCTTEPENDITVNVLILN